ncbi:MAG: serine hydrolase domain-containing protein, partial [Polyangiaceae bacterium]
MNRYLLHDPRAWVVASILVSAGSVALVACSSSSDSSATPTTPAGDTDASSEIDASTDDGPIDPKYQKFANAFDAERAKLGASGASVAIMEHGKLTFFHGFGTKGPSSKDVVKATTLFRIGSMTKALTSTALLGLVAEKKVALDIPV